MYIKDKSNLVIAPGDISAEGSNRLFWFAPVSASTSALVSLPASLPASLPVSLPASPALPLPDFPPDSEARFASYAHSRFLY